MANARLSRTIRHPLASGCQKKEYSINRAAEICYYSSVLSTFRVGCVSVYHIWPSVFILLSILPVMVRSARLGLGRKVLRFFFLSFSNTNREHGPIFWRVCDRYWLLNGFDLRLFTTLLCIDRNIVNLTTAGTSC